MWIVFALLAALSAGVSVVLSKAGLKNVDSTLAFAIQSVLIVTISWSAAFWQKDVSTIGQIDKRAWLFLVAAGIATTLSSLFTFRALKLGDAALVSSMERSSLVFAVGLAAIFLNEQLNWKIIVGGLMIIGGAILVGLSRQGDGS
jgi:transporter family protein